MIIILALLVSCILILTFLNLNDNYHEKLPPMFDSLVNKQKQLFIVQICKAISRNSTKTKNVLYFPYVSINAPYDKVAVYKITFLPHESFRITPQKFINFPTEPTTCTFSFETGEFIITQSLDKKRLYKLENTANEIKVKWRLDDGIYDVVSIRLHDNFQWLSENSKTDLDKINVCKYVTGTASGSTFPIPVSKIVDKSDIVDIIKQDSMFAVKKEFAGYGIFGSKFKYNEYGECSGKQYERKFCPKNTVYAGNGLCAELDNVTKTCLEFPKAIIKHTSSTLKFFKCRNTFPFYKERSCPPNKFFDAEQLKCVQVNVCKHTANGNIAVPPELKASYPTESYIECINENPVIRDCRDKFPNGKLSARGDLCCDIECGDSFDRAWLIQIENLTKNALIEKFPGDYKACDGGRLRRNIFIDDTRPILRTVKERIRKHDDTDDSIIEYDLPTFIYTLDDVRGVEKKYLYTFRDAPDLFTIRQIPVRSMKRERGHRYVYIDDNINTTTDDDLLCRKVGQGI